MTGNAPLKLIYVAGYGRSGSTLLDIALGAHPEIFGAGEIGEFTRHVWAENEYCSCGSRARSCALWSRVFNSWAEDGPAQLSDYVAEQSAREGILSWRRIFHGQPDRFAALTRKLLSNISSASGRRIIVDSNKLPGRGFVLASLPEVEVYLVHLVRDPRAVAFSMRKSIKRRVEAGVQKEIRPRPLLYATVRWLIVNLAAEALAARLGTTRSVRVRYEDFVADPRSSLEAILSLVGKDAEGMPDGLTAPLRPYHQISGSRHRMQRQLLIRTDEAWRSSMSPVGKLLVTLLCAPLLWRYGYPWQGRSPDPLQKVLA